jgi:two-component sensor histidine kinase
VRLKKHDKELELTIMDNGVGVPDGFDWKNSSTLGLKLVRTLVKNQLDGSIDMKSNNGTKFTIKFNIET